MDGVASVLGLHVGYVGNQVATSLSRSVQNPAHKSTLERVVACPRVVIAFRFRPATTGVAYDECAEARRPEDAAAEMHYLSDAELETARQPWISTRSCCGDLVILRVATIIPVAKTHLTANMRDDRQCFDVV